MFSNYIHSRSHSSKAGFSLLEVLLTVAIIGIITAVVLTRYGTFNSTVLLKNQAFELALAIREAQVLSTSVRGQGSGGASDFRRNYGIHIDRDATSRYILFIDSNDNGIYDAGSDELVQTGIFDSRYGISNFCVTRTGNQVFCLNGPSNIDGLNITFRRPSFNPQMVATNAGATFSNVISAEIELTTITDTARTRKVVINTTGRISVE